MSKKLFYRLYLMLIMSLTIVSCSRDESNFVNNEPSVETDEGGMHYYKFSLNCDVTAYEDATTRGALWTWDNGSTLIVRFKNGSKFISGLATYTSVDNLWTFATYETLPIISGEETCELYYFYGDIRRSDTNLTMSEKTSCYYTTTAKYRHPSESSFSVNGFMDRKTWRLRFKGTFGTTITLPGNENDIKYLSAFNGLTGSFTDSQKDINLSVGNDGYTTYIYGTFVNNSGKNKITVKNGGSGYKKELTSTELSIGESAYLTIPTESSHSGWEVLSTGPDPVPDPNATIQAENMVTFVDGIVMTWKLGSTVNTFDYTVFPKSEAESMSDDQLADKIYGSDPETLETANYLFANFNSEWYSADTEYYLCAVAKNSFGQRGPVLRQLFKSNANNLPSAEISNIKTASSTKWTFDISLKNNAKSYYLATSTDEEDYNDDWHWFAYYVYRWGSAGQLEARDWSSVASTLQSGTCNILTVCTWGLDANKKMGNPNVAFGSASSSVKSLGPVHFAPKKRMISPEKLRKIRENTAIYLISE